MSKIKVDYFDNRLANCHNPYQGTYKKVLCVCSAGLLRSPTAAWVLSQEPYNYNTRAAGCVASYALVLVDKVLVEWADEIICMNLPHVSAIKVFGGEGKIFCLNIPDTFSYRDEKLIEAIRTNYDKVVLGK